jgi:hypothetical protein
MPRLPPVTSATFPSSVPIKNPNRRRIPINEEPSTARGRQ